jgi:O-antigen/teichoic acid export membrane protein
MSGSAVQGALERRALSLGSANAIDFALQFLLPIVLARALDVESFGKYRLLWLAVSTIMVLAPLAMPHSLYYFLPRADADRKRLYINQTLLFLCVTGTVAAWALSALDPWRPESLHTLSDTEYLVPLFALVWTVSSMLDLLPTVEERVDWQSRIIVGLSALRALALSSAAILTGELAPVLWTLVGFAVFKLVLLAWYIARHHRWARPMVDWAAFRDQLRYAGPFGLSAAFYGLRSQVDQWVSAALFSIHQFAAFSVAAVIGPLIFICRQSVNHVFLPSMSRLEAAGNVTGMLALNSRANAMVAALLYPVLAFAVLFAPDIITVIYTDSYLEAVPVMRLYALSMACLVVELNSVMLLLREGPFTLRVNAFLLALSAATSAWGASAFGLPGAAAGSVLAVFVDRILTVRRISLRTGISIAQMQDWRSLGTLIALAAVAALVVWTAVHGRLDGYGPLVRLAVAGALMSAVYVLLLLMLRADDRFGALREFIALRGRRARDAEV